MSAILQTIKIVLAALGLMVWAPVSAHLSPNTEIRLDAREKGASVEVIVPASEYRVVTGNATGNEREALERARLAIANALSLESDKGAAWAITLESVEFTSGNGPSDLKATLTAVAPRDASPRVFSLRWGLLSGASAGSVALVYLTGDRSENGAAQARLLGGLTPADYTLEVDLGASGGARPGFDAFWLGVHHILEGYDHLLFLIALMLPAPLVASHGKWSLVRPTTGAITHIAIIVTAFTLGHSLTLALASFWPISLPAVLVESVIAISVLVSAAHAIRPIFPDKEPVVGFAFGLIHGLAFATLLDQSGLAVGGGMAALTGFTLGIEAVQLGLAACVMPALVLLSRAQFYSRLRITAGFIVLLTAGLWLINRTTGAGGQLVEVIEAAMAYGGIFIAGLILAALAVRLRSAHAKPAVKARM